MKFQKADNAVKIAISPNDDGRRLGHLLLRQAAEPLHQFQLHGRRVFASNDFKGFGNFLVPRFQSDAQVNMFLPFIILFNHAPARIQNALMRAVIRVERDNTHGWPAPLEQKEILYRGSLKAINSLLLVADDKDIRRFKKFGQESYDQVLSVISVLMFINVNI